MDAKHALQEGTWGETFSPLPGKERGEPQFFRLLSVAILLAYRFTAIGWPWLFIRPLIPVASSFWIFNQVAGVQAEGGTPYLLFSLAGVAVWQCFETALLLMTRSDKVLFFFRKRYGPADNVPPLPLLVASGAPALIELACTVVPIVLLAGYFFLTTGVLHVRPEPGLLFVVPAVALAYLLALGFGLVTSVFVGKMRDLSLGLGYGLRFWQYVTPVFYPVALIPEAATWVNAVNPMSPIVALFRGALLGTPDGAPWQPLVSAVGLTAAVLLVGLAFHRRFPTPPKRFTHDPFGSDEVLE